MSAFPEPTAGLWMWLDNSGDPFAIFAKDTRTDAVRRDPDDCWFNTDLWAGDDIHGMTWAEVLNEMRGMDGPYELVRADGKAVAQ